MLASRIGRTISKTLPSPTAVRTVSVPPSSPPRSAFTVVDPSADRLAIYVAGDKAVKFAGDGTMFAGVVYAPLSIIEVTGTSEFSGAFVGKQVKLTNKARVHFDSSLGGDDDDSPEPAAGEE